MKIFLHKNDQKEPFSLHCDPREVTIHDNTNIVHHMIQCGLFSKNIKIKNKPQNGQKIRYQKLSGIVFMLE